MLVKTDLRVTPFAAAYDVSYQPSAGVNEIDVQAAIEAVQANVAAGAVTPPVLVPKVVTFAMSPYAMLTTDYLIEVDVTGGAVTINLQPAAAMGNIASIIKHSAGNAAANNISLVPNGAEVVEGLAPYLLDYNGAAVELIPNSPTGYLAGP